MITAVIYPSQFQLSLDDVIDPENQIDLYCDLINF